MGKKRIEILCLTVLLFGFSGCSQADVEKNEVRLAQTGTTDEVTVDIYGTSDTHGVFDSYDYEKNEEQTLGSLAQICTYIKAQRELHPNLLLVDTGDIVVGNNAEIYKDDVRNPMIAALEYLQYDTFTYGNHEFNFGSDYAKKWKDEFSTVDVLCANIFMDDGQQLGKSYVIKDVSGVKVAIIGLTTSKVIDYDGDKLEGWTAKDPVLRCEEVINDIKENGGADLYVLAAHIGVEEESYEGDDIRDIMAACPDLDAVFAGHSHKVISEQDDGILLMMPGCKAQWVSHAEFLMKQDENGEWTIADSWCETASMEDVEPDAEFAKLFWEYHIRGVQNTEESST